MHILKYSIKIPSTVNPLAKSLATVYVYKSMISKIILKPGRNISGLVRREPQDLPT